jgi:hypothetical protein
MKANAVFYIKNGTIKFLQVSLGPKKTVTTKEVLLTEGQNVEAMSQTLKAWVAERNINFTENRVTVLVPRSRVIFRTMSFPSHQQDEIRSMIDLQIGSHIPYVREEVEVDFHVLSKTPDGYAKVAVAVIPKEIVMHTWKIFADAGIPVHSISVSSVGEWLLYQQHAAASDDKPTAILDLDADHSEICIGRRSHWLTCREIPIGLRQVEQEGYGELLKQWELTASHLEGEKLNLESVYLIKSNTDLHTLASEIEKIQKGIKINTIQLPESLWHENISFAALAGIAFNPEPAPINLIPQEVRQSQTRTNWHRQLIISGIWVVAAVISLGLAFAVGFFKKNIQMAHLEMQLHGAKRKAFLVEDEFTKINNLESMVKNRFIFSDFSHELYRLLGPQVYLTNITVSEGHNLSVEGDSPDPVAVNLFQKGMVDSPYFANVTLNYVNKRASPQGEITHFKISCTFKTMDLTR